MSNGYRDPELLAPDPKFGLKNEHSIQALQKMDKRNYRLAVARRSLNKSRGDGRSK